MKGEAAKDNLLGRGRFKRLQVSEEWTRQVQENLKRGKAMREEEEAKAWREFLMAVAAGILLVGGALAAVLWG